MAEKEADKKVQTEEVPTTQVLQENEDDSMKTQLNEAVSLDLKKLKATVDKTSDSKINEEQEASDQKEEIDVEETKDEEKETKDEKEENKEGEGKSKEVSEVEDKKEEGAEAEDKEEEGTEAEDKEKKGAEAEDKKKEGSEAEDKEEEGTEAEDKEKEGAEAEYKNKEGTGAEVKTEEGAESNFELGAVRRRKKKEGTESLQYRLKVCQGNKDGRHGTRGPTLGSDRTQRQRRRVSKKIYVCYDRDACLYAHNKARDCHKLSMLTWDTKLAEDAKNWAIHLVENNLFCHQGGVGENLYEMPYSEKCHRVYHAVYDQYNEIEDYDFNNPRKYETDDCEFKKIGHFSQIVWKETTKIGCCVAFDKDSKRTVIVTRFDPMQGYAFTEQVPRCRPAKIPSTVEDFINEYDVPPSLEGVEGYML